MEPVAFFPVPPKTNAEAVVFMEDVLTRVKNGTLHAVFFAGVSAAGEIHTGFVPAGRLFELIGAVESAKYRLMVANVEVRAGETLL